MTTQRGTYGRDVLVSVGFTGLIVLSALANSVVIARMVGTEGRGLYALLVAVTALAWPLAGGGLNHAATWRVGGGDDVSRVATLNHVWAALVLLVGGGVAAGHTLGAAGGAEDAGDGEVLVEGHAVVEDVGALTGDVHAGGDVEKFQVAENAGGERLAAFDYVGLPAELVARAVQAEGFALHSAFRALHQVHSRRRFRAAGEQPQAPHWPDAATGHPRG